MIFDLIANGVITLANKAFSLLPDASSTPSGITNVFTQLASVLKYVNILFDVNDLLICGTLILGSITAWVILILVTWGANLIPGFKPFSRLPPSGRGTVTSQTSFRNGRLSKSTSITTRRRI